MIQLKLTLNLTVPYCRLQKMGMDPIQPTNTLILRTTNYSPYYKDSQNGPLTDFKTISLEGLGLRLGDLELGLYYGLESHT